MSRSLKTWGTSESALAEMVAHRLDALDESGEATIAFLARGIEGLVVRITAKGATEADAWAIVDKEEKELRAILGDLVFGVDDETMEFAVLDRLRARGWSLGVAESVTGGLHRRPHRERAGRERRVPRHDRRVRDRREALGARRDRRGRS